MDSEIQTWHTCVQTMFQLSEKAFTSFRLVLTV